MALNPGQLATISDLFWRGSHPSLAGGPSDPTSPVLSVPTTQGVFTQGGGQVEFAPADFSIQPVPTPQPNPIQEAFARSQGVREQPRALPSTSGLERAREVAAPQAAVHDLPQLETSGGVRDFFSSPIFQAFMEFLEMRGLSF